MELMSPMFLCALVALLPQALGKSRKFSSVSDLVKFKNEKNTHSVTKFNLTSNINKVSDLQSVFMNPLCKECHNCMELSIKAHKVHSHMSTEIKTNDIPNEFDNLEENTTHRNKRNLEVDTQAKFNKHSAKKSKAKKNKNNKSVSVTKYRNEGKLYALKVKETITPPILLDLQNQTKAPVSKCQVYRVKETFSCDAPEAALILTEQRKINKTTNKLDRNKEMNLSKNKETERSMEPQFKKRNVADEPQVPENFMPSIEEMY